MRRRERNVLGRSSRRRLLRRQGESQERAHDRADSHTCEQGDQEAEPISGGGRAGDERVSHNATEHDGADNGHEKQEDEEDGVGTPVDNLDWLSPAGSHLGHSRRY